MACAPPAAPLQMWLVAEGASMAPADTIAMLGMQQDK
jgi:hypothetical protein